MWNRNGKTYVTEGRANPRFSFQVQSTCLCALSCFSSSTRYMYLVLFSIFDAQGTSTSFLLKNMVLRYKSTRFFVILSPKKQYFSWKGTASRQWINKKSASFNWTENGFLKSVFENQKIHFNLVESDRKNNSPLDIWKTTLKTCVKTIVVPRCTFVVPESKSRVQSTKYSTSTCTSTGIYFSNVWF